MKTDAPFHKAGFSLVEVTVAIGIVSFCLISIVALLPAGLKSVKNATAESAAAEAFEQISSAIRDGTTNAAGVYAANGAFSGLTWSVGGGALSTNYYFTLAGQPTNSANGRLVGRVELIPPTNNMSTGRARISIAWPSTASWSNNAWVNADGSLSSGVTFFPKLPNK